MGLLDLFMFNLTAPIHNSEEQCIKNPKKFLFFKWFGRHPWKKEALITPWGALDWHKYEVETVCRRCGLTKRFWGKSEALLLRNGVPIKKLAECRMTDDWVKVQQK